MQNSDYKNCFITKSPPSIVYVVLEPNLPDVLSLSLSLVLRLQCALPLKLFIPSSINSEKNHSLTPTETSASALYFVEISGGLENLLLIRVKWPIPNQVNKAAGGGRSYLMDDSIIYDCEILLFARQLRRL